MPRTRRIIGLFLLLSAFGCGDDSSSLDGSTPNPDGGLDAQNDAMLDAPIDGGEAVPYLTEILSLAAFESLATETREVKLLIQAPGGTLPGSLAEHPVVFANTRTYPLHINLIRSLPGLENYSPASYQNDASFRDSRVFAPANLFWFPNAVHPTGSIGVMAYIFAVDPAEAPITPEEWAEFDTRLSARVSFPTSDVVLIGVSPEQETWLLDHKTELAALDVTVMAQRELTRAAIEVYSAGESYGYLHTFAPDERVENYGPRDIVIADAAHDDISLLSALITTFPQSTGSHLNLRLREKGLPNLRWVGAREDERIQGQQGQLVHLVVTMAGEILIEPATLTDAEAFWQMLQPPLEDPDADLEELRMQPLADLAHADATRYGVKAANLAELHRALTAEHRATGFAIPFAEYAAHVSRTDIQSAITSLIADDSLRTDREALSTRLRALRRLIRRAPIEATLLSRMQTVLMEVFGAEGATTFMRFRSSTNAEDLEVFSGAGLYDSKTGCLADDLDGDEIGPSRCLSDSDISRLNERLADFRTRLAADPSQTWLQDAITDIEEDLVEEKTVEDAIRKVWRSLWNLRAFEERAYYGITHTSVYMGIAVIPSFQFERREAVILSNLPHGDEDTGLYHVVSQVGDLGVVRPDDPRAQAEEMTFVREGDALTEYHILRHSSESPGVDLWDTESRTTLAMQLFIASDHFESIYPDRRPLRLDMEVEVTDDHRIVIKQVRPYLGVP